MVTMMAKRLQLPSEVVSKAMEYQRLVALKCSVLSKQYSENCIAVICLQLAASHSMGIQFDKVSPWHGHNSLTMRPMLWGNPLCR